MDRREQILSTAYERLGREGLEALHARSVAGDIGINHAAIHYYFPTRKDLILALIDYALERFEHDRAAALAQAGGDAEAVEAEIALYDAYASDRSRFFRVWVSFYVAAMADAVIMSRLRTLNDRWEQAFLESSDRAKAAGVHVVDSGIGGPRRFIATALGLALLAHAAGESSASTAFDHIYEELLPG